MKQVILLLMFVSIARLVCDEEFEETVCSDLTLSSAITLNSTTAKLRIKNVTGSIIHENVSNLKAVAELEIAESAITSIEPGALCCVPKLTTVNLRANKIFPVINKDLFEDCGNLKRLYLSGPNLRIEHSPFGDLGGLHTLSLNDTRFPENTPSILQPLWNLRSLTVRNSKIPILQKGTFDGVANLKSLDLERTGVEFLEAGVFAGLPNLTSLNLSGNKLGNLTWNEFEGLKSLRVLFLERNNISNVNIARLVARLPKLERIFLSWDKLTPQARDQLEQTLPLLNITLIYSGYPVQ